MGYDPLIHLRRSIRLKGYNYAKAGAYFITICCENRLHRFGKVSGSEMILMRSMGKPWQRNYYEHIIRDENAYYNISNYIINNPAKWTEDKFHH